jgi:hypothetical protein
MLYTNLFVQLAAFQKFDKVKLGLPVSTNTPNLQTPHHS